MKRTRPEEREPAAVVDFARERAKSLRTKADTRTVAGLATVYFAEGLHEGLKARSIKGYRTALRYFGAHPVVGPDGRETGAWEQRTCDGTCAVFRRDRCGLVGGAEREDVAAYMRHLRDGLDLEPKSVNSALANVRAIMRLAGGAAHDTHLWETMLATPDLKGGKRRERRAPPDDGLQRLSALCRPEATPHGLGERLLLRLVALGCRTEETTAIQPADYSRRTGVLTVYRSGKREDSRKNEHPHSIPLDDETRRLFERVLSLGPQAMKPKGGTFKPGWDAFVLPWSKKYIEGFTARLRKGLGEDADAYMPKGRERADGKRVAGTAFYCLRHLGASKAAEVTGSVVEVGALLGDRGMRTPGTYMSAVRGETSAHRHTVASVAAMLDGGPSAPPAPVPVRAPPVVARPVPVHVPSPAPRRPLQGRFDVGPRTPRPPGVAHVVGDPSGYRWGPGGWERVPTVGEVARLDPSVAWALGYGVTDA